MAPFRDGTVFVGLLTAVAAGGLLFTQPTIRTPAQARFQAAGWQAEPPRTAAGSSSEPSSMEAGAFKGLLAGLLCGLAVGLAGAGAAEAKDPPPLPQAKPGYVDIFRSSPEDGKKWGKEKFKKWGDFQFSKPWDPKHGVPSTGAGRYAQFGLDAYSPVATIPRTNNGTYPLVNSRAPGKVKDAYNPKAMADADPALKARLLKASKTKTQLSLSPYATGTIDK